MVHGWVAAGSPIRSVRFGDYSEWASMMAGILDYLEVPGWLADRTTASSARDAEDQEWGAFLAAWHDAFSTNAVTAGKVLEALADYVPAAPDKSATVANGRQLGRWLGSRNGRYFGDFKLIGAHDLHAKQVLWRVEPFVRKSSGGAA